MGRMKEVWYGVTFVKTVDSAGAVRKSSVGVVWCKVWVAPLLPPPPGTPSSWNTLLLRRGCSQGVLVLLVGCEYLKCEGGDLARRKNSSLRNGK
jgi:hypothetical protein